MSAKTLVSVVCICLGLAAGGAFAVADNDHRPENAREDGLAKALEQIGANDNTETAQSILEQLSELVMPDDAGQHPVPPLVNDHSGGNSAAGGFDPENRTGGLSTALESIGDDNPGMAQSVIEQLLLQEDPGPPNVEPNELLGQTLSPDSFAPVAIPEPATLGLLILGSLALLWRRRVH